MSQTPASPTFHERVLPSLPALLPLLLIPAGTLLTFLPFDELLGLGMGLGVVAVCLVSIWFAAPELEVDQSGFSVGETQLPARYVGRVEIVGAAEAFEERGPKLHALAYTRFQISVKTLVKIEVLDPDDPTPYWLVATKRPAQLKAALEQLAG